MPTRCGPPLRTGIYTNRGGGMTLFERLHEQRDAAKAAERAHVPNRINVIRKSTEGTSSYGAQALDDECAQLRDTAEGQRNDRLNVAAVKIAGLVAGGEIGENDAREALTDAALDAGLEPNEIRATLDSGFRKGLSNPRERADLDQEMVEWLGNTPGPHERTAATAATVSLTSRTTPTASQSAGAEDVTSTSTGASTTTEAPDSPEARYGRLVATAAAKLQINRDAKRRIDHADATSAFRVPPFLPTLADDLQLPDEPVAYTVDELMPLGANVLLTAQFKTGKTTLVNALTRALADQEPFLGRWQVAELNGRVAVFNYEVDSRQYRRWLRDVEIKHPEHVAVFNLRGYSVPLMVPFIQDQVVEWLKRAEARVWIVDPFARAYTGSGKSENDNTEVGAFLDALDVIKSRAGVGELVLPTHTGRGEVEQGQERARGATRLDDWADVRWLLTKDDEGSRYFSATGRDVDVAEGMLTYDEFKRAYEFTEGDRRAQKDKASLDKVLRIIASNPGATANAIAVELGGKRDAVLKVLREAVGDGLAVMVPGPNNSHKHYIKGHELAVVPAVVPGSSRGN